MADRSFTTRAGWLLIAIAVAATGGAAASAALLQEPPSDLGSAESTRRIAVGTDLFDDARDVKLSAKNLEPVPLFAPSSGRVTAFHCERGAVVSSGSSPLSLDGRAALALATRVPLWRDLPVGTVGDDVRAFQEELNRLGYSITPDGSFGTKTMTAAKAAFARAGVSVPADSIPIASILWIPGSEVTLSECQASLGANVDQGATIAAFTSRASTVSILNPPVDLLDGARQVVLGDSRFPVDSEGVIHVPDLDVLGIAPSSGGSDRGSDKSTKPIDAQLVLVDPVPVSVVPPSAVYKLVSGKGCVSARGVPFPVDVLGSQLGETLVTFPGGPAPTQVDTSPQKSSKCR